MNQTQKIGVGAVVLAVLSYGAYAANKKDQSTGFATKDSKKTELPEIKGSDDLDKLVITNADKGEIVLEKTAGLAGGDAGAGAAGGGGKWMVTKPVVAPANQANVKSLLDNLKELKVSEQIEPTATEEIKKTYALEPTKAVRIVGYKGADKKVDDLFGKSGGRGQVVTVEGKPGVFIATGYSSYLYTRETKNWRDNEIFKFDDAIATQLTIDKKSGPLSFTKAGDPGKWAGTFKGQPIANLDEEKVKEALRALKNLTADDFGDGKTAAETGLDAPESTVTVSLKDNAGKYALKVGKVATGTSRYAQKDGDPTVFVIANYAADWATAEPTKFEKSKDAGADGGKTAMPMPMGMPPGMQGMPGMPPGHPPH